jgi:Flp pilus assembly protein TadB
LPTGQVGHRGVRWQREPAMTPKRPEAVRITTARRSRSADIRSREVRYLISMGVRTVCFILAIVVSGPLRWVFVVAAFVLPYFAVVMANAGSRPDTGAPAPFDPTAKPALNAPPAGGTTDAPR